MCKIPLMIFDHSHSLDMVPYYPGLRHFRNLDVILAPADGNNYLDLMRQILPSLLVAFTASGDVTILAFRALAEIRTLTSFINFDDERLDLLSDAVTKYSPLAQVSTSKWGCSVYSPIGS